MADLLIRPSAEPGRAPSSRPRFHGGRVVAFFAVTYLLSWAWTLPQALTGQVVMQGRGWPTHFPSLLGPLLAAFVVTAATTGRPGLADLLARMGRWRVPARWWLVAVSPAAFLVVALAAAAASGRPMPTAADFGRFSGLPAVGVAGVFVLLLLINGYGEETGWRGYALPQLQLRFPPLVATLILAPLWALWHLPTFWVINSYRTFTVGAGVGWFLGLTCGAIVLTWLYNGSGGSVLIVVVWHATYNLVGATAAAHGLTAAVVTTLVMAQAVVLVALDVRARRRGTVSVLAAR